MKINFLAAKQPLAKCFQVLLGKLETQSYPPVVRFTSSEVEVNNLIDFYAALCTHAAIGACLLKGQLKKALTNESRAGQTDPVHPTDYICFDLDGLVGFTPDSFMAEIGLGDISYTVQYSASAGVKPEKGLSCHIFVLLDQPVAPPLLKLWLTKLNFEHFKNFITLNRLGESLHWPLDTTTCQNDKLLYIAPPICIPPELDTFNQPRIQLVNKSVLTFSFPTTFKLPNVNLAENLINELRKKEGLTKLKKPKIDKKSGEEYQPTTSKAWVSDFKVGDEFTHLNLNGGDSWGYYHLTKEPLFLYNFKGEPVYKLQEIVPDYWRKLKEASRDPTRTVLALRDFKTATYYNGWYETSTDTLELAQAASKDQLHDFLTTNGVPIPEAMGDWHCSYDPCSEHPDRVDFDARKINWFIPSKYMRYVANPSEQYMRNFPTIKQLLENVLGADQGLIEHFLNWVACAFRYRLPCGTAWIMQGVPGTGKSLLVNKLLNPLFGATNVVSKRMTELHERFNEYIAGSLLCYIDEISIGEDQHHDRIMADLKQYITEPTINIRRMRVAAQEVRNHSNWIFSTNNKQPIRIEPGDRRYNVGEFCTRPLKDLGDTHEFVKKLTAELSEFTIHLLQCDADERKASSVFRNTARQQMIMSSMVTGDLVAKAIIDGDLEQLYEWVDDPSIIADNVRFASIKAYRDLIHELIMTQRNYLQREDLFTIFAATAGRVPRESAKFGQYLKYHEVTLEPMTRNGKSIRGVHVKWAADSEWLTEVQKELSLGKVVPLTKVK